MVAVAGGSWAGRSLVECGEWLVAELVDSDRAQVAWLAALAEFDLASGWALDGQLSCAEWLIWRGQMSRSSAYEKLQVAHQLRLRPIMRAAFEDGLISYSVARVMARITGPDPGVDQALIALAQAGTVRDVENMAAYYSRHAEQHRPPRNTACHRRGVRVRPGYDGTTTIEITLTDLEAQEAMAAITAFITNPPADPAQSAHADSDHHGTQSAHADWPAGEAPADAASDDDAEADDPAQSARADWQEGEAPAEQASWQAQRADAALAMARTALAHAQHSQASGADRYLVHLAMTGDHITTLDGTPLDPATAQQIRCDSSQVQLLLGPDWEPLAMGRRTRTWTTAQRRAARVRDHGQCRFPGIEAR